MSTGPPRVPMRRQSYPFPPAGYRLRLPEPPGPPGVPFEQGPWGRGRARSPWLLDAQVRERGRGGDPASWGALEEAELEQVGLGHVLDRVLLLPHRHGQGGQPDRGAAEALAQHPQQGQVELVQAKAVDLEQLQG